MEIVVISDNQNPANFVSNFVDSINVNDGYDIVLKVYFIHLNSTLSKIPSLLLSQL